MYKLILLTIIILYQFNNVFNNENINKYKTKLGFIREKYIDNTQVARTRVKHIFSKIGDLKIKIVYRNDFSSTKFSNFEKYNDYTRIHSLTENEMNDPMEFIKEMVVDKKLYIHPLTLVQLIKYISVWGTQRELKFYDPNLMDLENDKSIITTYREIIWFSFDRRDDIINLEKFDISDFTQFVVYVGDYNEDNEIRYYGFTDSGVKLMTYTEWREDFRQRVQNFIRDYIDDEYQVENVFSYGMPMSEILETQQYYLNCAINNNGFILIDYNCVINTY